MFLLFFQYVFTMQVVFLQQHSSFSYPCAYFLCFLLIILLKSVHILQYIEAAYANANDIS